MKTNNRKDLLICMAASGGGHLVQLLQLAKGLQGYNTFYVTTTKTVPNELQNHSKVYVIGDCNRKHPVRILKVLFQCIRIILRERPEAVISTGAAPGFVLCLLAKSFGAKIIWIDSIANVESLSLSGRMVWPIADLLLTQWPELAKRHSKVEYAGTII